MMNRAKIRMRLICAIIVFIALSCLLFTAAAPIRTAAETSHETAETDIAAAPQSDEEREDIGALAQAFLTRLRAKYGEDYEIYLNAILAKWDSVEEYLLSMADEADPSADGWRGFVTWLGENAPVWAPVLAIILVIVVALVGKKAVQKVLEWLDRKKKPMYGAMNKLFEAQIAQGKALRLLLGETAKTEETRAALDAAMEKLAEVDDGA